MTKNFFLITLAFILVIVSFENECNMNEEERIDCGYSGIDQEKCENNGCCWAPGSGPDIPWCFMQKKDDNNICPNFDTIFDGPGFTGDDVEKMKKYFEANLNVNGKGGVAASFDHDTPGGDYFYHWVRDGALSMKAYMIIHDYKYQEIKQYMDSYVNWVLEIENNISEEVDVRVEPKFNLPNGELFEESWCRPQIDGPGLRASTLSMYGTILIENNQERYAKGRIFNLIKKDLDWITENWDTETCDIWENARSNDFFWVRYTMRKGLLDGAKFMSKIGKATLGRHYTEVAKKIQKGLSSHWNGRFLMESLNKQRDSAVILGIIEGYANDNYLDPLDFKIALTLKELNKYFCGIYLVNKIDSKMSIPGVLHGRYEGDFYAGGNPWVLTTANVATTYYQAAAYTLNRTKNFRPITDREIDAWSGALGKNLKREITFIENKELTIANELANAGDAVMQRIYYHVKEDKGHLNEQIDRNTGAQICASDLTWSYSSILIALKARDEAFKSINTLLNVK